MPWLDALIYSGTLLLRVLVLYGAARFYTKLWWRRRVQKEWRARVARREARVLRDAIARLGGSDYEDCGDADHDMWISEGWPCPVCASRKR